MLKKAKTRLLARAAQKHVHVFAGSYRAATARERWSNGLSRHLLAGENLCRGTVGVRVRDSSKFDRVRVSAAKCNDERDCTAAHRFHYHQVALPQTFK